MHSAASSWLVTICALFHDILYEPIKVPLIEIRYFVYIVYGVWVEKDMGRSSCSSCYDTLTGKILVLAGLLKIAISESGFVLVVSWLFKTYCSHLNLLIVEWCTHFCSSEVHLVLTRAWQLYHVKAWPLFFALNVKGSAHEQWWYGG